jgi:formylglycine-generating enzyme required for sulfatase activity
MPAVGISRHAAEQYCAWLSLRTGRTYRLPTEAEWEAACAGAMDRDAQAWHAGNSGGQPRPVGTRAPDAHGLCDLLGNAWEWCSGPFAPEDDRPVMRGGCWDSPPAQCDCTSRRGCPEAWNDSDAQRPRGIWWLADGPYVGFRVLRPR